ncbi:hypothetical protein OG802_32615 [Streptomyces sp. NBC_00704]|uniref:hypothetical protein n=1 Tax=Streptomyces sp. NBC_00704 TaxID=2975809 RepID=UPI002E31D903|nr:hypothetical protein [Streptomyces sp. NBC_00704]
MPRNRPRRAAAGASHHRASSAQPVIDGLSSRALSEVHRLERTRNYLSPGDVAMALRQWKDYVRRPERELWQDFEADGGLYWDCCGDPLEARALLDTVTQALSPRTARELRRLIARSDALWNRPSPSYLADD